MKEQIAPYADNWQLPDAAILAAIEADTVPNPAPQAQIKVRLEKMAALSLLGNESKVKVLRYQNLPLVYQSFDAQDHTSCLSWVQALYICGDITEAELIAEMAYINSTVPDPTYRAAIPALEIEIGRAVTLADVWMARKEYEKENS